MENSNGENLELDKLWKMKKIQIINLALGNEFQRNKSRSILWRVLLFSYV